MTSFHPPAYNAAIVGVGRAGSGTELKGGGHQIGYTHAGMYQRSERVRLESAADINAENLAAFQERFDVTNGFADYGDLLATVRPDIVSICTYVGLHRPIIEAAARAGVRGIVCEKPFLAAPADLPVVRELAASTGVKIVAAHVRRYRPAFARAKELYTSGAIGLPVMCMAGIEGWDLSEWGSHWLDMFRFLHADQPAAWVMGQARVRDLRGYGHAMEEHAVAYVGFPDGGRAMLDGGLALNGGYKRGGDCSMVLVSTEGTIRVMNEDRLVIDDASGRREESFAHDPAGRWPALWDRLLADLVAWMDGGAEPMTGLTNVLHSSEVNLAAYLSAVRGDRVDLPLDDALDEWPVEVLAQRARPERGKE
jgi:predicted dehydrogenase